jgi:hypothetical protein
MQLDSTPTAKKEPVMKNRAYAVVLAAVVALMAASGALAKAPSTHANVKLAQHSLVRANVRQAQHSLVRANVRQAQHSLVRANQKASYGSIDRRWARGIF